MYNLSNQFNNYNPGVAVVGCGGTGGFVAEGLCRLLAPETKIILVDGDTVEPQNLGRQNFLREDLGRFKAQALAERLARQFDRPVAYSLKYLTADRLGGRPHALNCHLVIGCVDNALARQAIEAGMRQIHSGWWVDAGNSENWGQILIGNADIEQMGRIFDPEDQTCVALPLPSIQRPELLLEAAPVEDDPDCAVAVQLGDQSPTINQNMAALVLEVVRRLIDGTCPWMALFLDMDTGEMKPTYATPEAVARVTGLRRNNLVSQPPKEG